MTTQDDTIETTGTPCQLEEFGVKIDPTSASPRVLIHVGDTEYELCASCARNLALTLTDTARDAERFVFDRNSIADMTEHGSDADATALSMLLDFMKVYSPGGGSRRRRGGWRARVVGIVRGQVVSDDEIDDAGDKPKSKITPSV